MDRSLISAGLEVLLLVTTGFSLHLLYTVRKDIDKQKALVQEMQGLLDLLDGKKNEWQNKDWYIRRREA